MMDVSEKLRARTHSRWSSDVQAVEEFEDELCTEAANTIDALVDALGLVISMRNVDRLAPAVHAFEIEKRNEAWAKIDLEIDAALALARGEG